MSKLWRPPLISYAQAKRFYEARQDWLGEGDAATPEVAQARANTCLACPKHVIKPLQELLTASVAGYVRRQLELKTHLKMRVEHEEELHTCGICECWMPLKVWLNIERARGVTPDWQQFPANCWLHQQT